MSQEDVETMRRGIEAWNATVIEGCARSGDCRCRMDSGQSAAVERSVYRGKEEVAPAFAAIWRDLGGISIRESEVRRSSGDQSSGSVGFTRRGRASHVELEHDFAMSRNGARRQIQPSRGIPHVARRTRSRRALGVGDVAGERGEGPSSNRCDESR